MPLQEVFPAEKTGEKRMKIDKISLKNEQAWVTFRTDEGEYIGSDTKIKNVLKRVLNPNGRVISFGYNSVGMSKSRGFEKKAICLVCHNGNHQDTICRYLRTVCQ